MIVIGAGLAGLCAAYELQQLGYDVAVYEVRDRVGGRVHSLHDFAMRTTERRAKSVEGGGELIGSNHPLWNSYAQEFHLEFTDAKDYGNSPVRLNGRTLTFEETSQITDEMEKHFDQLNLSAESIVDPYEPWTNRDAKTLDTMSLATWLASLRCPNTTSRIARDMIGAQLVTDNGVPAAQQSMLGVLAMIKGHGIDKYWTDTEVYRCAGGNDRLAKKFRQKLKPGTVTLNTRVTRMAASAAGVNVTIQRVDRKTPPKIDIGSDVILTVPPSVWNRIEVADPMLRKLLRNAPRLGKNVKYLMKFDRRFWEDFASSPTLTEDGPVDLTWETSEAESGPDFTMVAFSGADHAQSIVRRKNQRDRDRLYRSQLETPYPGISREMTDRRLMDWPHEEWTRGSYYFPQPGEVSKWGPIWKKGFGDWLHFAGEHTCYAFVGYMEGALASGYRLARRLAVRDRLLQ